MQQQQNKYLQAIKLRFLQKHMHINCTQWCIFTTMQHVFEFRKKIKLIVYIIFTVFFGIFVLFIVN